MKTNNKINLQLINSKIQKIDVLKITKDFVFNKEDLIFDSSDFGCFIEVPNKNLEPFVYGEIYNYKNLSK